MFKFVLSPLRWRARTKGVLPTAPAEAPTIDTVLTMVYFTVDGSRRRENMLTVALLYVMHANAHKLWRRRGHCAALAIQRTGQAHAFTRLVLARSPCAKTTPPPSSPQRAPSCTRTLFPANLKLRGHHERSRFIVRSRRRYPIRAPAQVWTRFQEAREIHTRDKSGPQCEAETARCKRE